MIFYRLRDLNPPRFLHQNFSYQSLPNSESRSASPSSSYRWKWSAKKVRFGRLPLTKLLALAIGTFVLFALLAGGGYRYIKRNGAQQQPVPFVWQAYSRLNGYYNGIRTLVPPSNVTTENRYNASTPPRYEKPKTLSKQPPIDPIKYDPYPNYKSDESLKKHPEVHECFLDENNTITVPDVYAYPGVPEVYPEPFYGSYSTLGMRDDVCFDRFGRLAAYGYGRP
jgi:hypothetical protein